MSLKLRKLTVIALTSFMMASPLLAAADELDIKIKEQQEKIESLEENQNTAQSALQAIETEVATIEAEVSAVLKEKQKEEKTVTKLNEEIAHLMQVIEKRNQQLEKQAREVQTNQQANSFIEIMLESESLNDALAKAMALTTLVNANNDVLTAQQEDKAALEKLESEAEARLVKIQEKTVELQEKQQELLEARLSQEVRINELQAELSTEKAQKEKYQAQQKEAEEKRQQQLKALAEQKAKEEAARKAAEAQAAEALAAEEAAKAKAISATPVTLPKTKTNTNTNNNTTSTTPQQPTEEVVKTPAPSGSGWSAPVQNGMTVTSPFGWRANPTGPGQEHHDGIDLAGSSGTPIYASKGGKVVNASFQSSAGNVVIIQHDDGYYSYYMHLSSFAVSQGQQVSQGSQVGGMGTTGNSTGVHLHFGISTALWSGFVNPAPLLGL